MKLEPVVIDLTVADTRATPPVVAPLFDPATARHLVRDGVRVEVRGEFVVRIRPDGWVEKVTHIDPGAAVLATDQILVVVAREIDPKDERESLVLRLIGPTDAYRSITLPSWLAGAGEALELALAGDQLVFHTRTRTAWLPVARLHWLARVGAGPLKFCARRSGEEAQVVVTRGGETRAVVEGASGKRIMLMTQAVPVALGERLAVRAIDGAWALVNDAGETVATDDTIDLVRSAPSKKRSPFPEHDSYNVNAITISDFADDVLKRPARERIEKLSALGIVPVLDRAALEETAFAAFRVRHVPRLPALVAAIMLYEYFRAHPPDASRVLLDDDAVERAGRANLELDETRWHLVAMRDQEPFALCLSPAMHRAITTRDLLRLEPVPAYEPRPTDVEAVRAAIVRAIGCGDDECAIAPAPSRNLRVTVRLGVSAAAMLERLLRIE